MIFNQGLEIIEVEERGKSILSSVNSMCKESKNKYQVVRTPCVCVCVCGGGDGGLELRTECRLGLDWTGNSFYSKLQS